MKRGDIVTVALQGDFGKPRPALLIQADHFAQVESVTVLLMSSTLVDAPLLRVTVSPTALNGLRKPSDVMIDKVMTVRRDKVGPAIGRLDDEVLLAVTRHLAVFFGIA